jgi:DNA-binding NarL/FixJ family response regulator
VIAVSSHSDYPLVMRVLQAGARAFILTEGGLEELQRAVQASHRRAHLSQPRPRGDHCALAR